MRYHITLFIFFAFTQLFAQQAGLVKGVVSDAENKNISFASVYLLNAEKNSLVKAGFTNEKGVYNLTPLAAGSYYVKVEFAGMAPYQSEKFTLAAGETKELTPVVMTLAEAKLDEVKIRARKPLIEVLPDKTVFNVSGNTNAIGENALDLLRKAPGVIVDNNDNITLLGKSGVQVFIDGKPSPLSVEDLAQMLRGMQSDQIESFEIITNPSARYDAQGNAGIINIRLKKDKSLGANANINLGFARGVTPRPNFNRYNGSITANFRNKKVNVFGNYTGVIGTRYNFFISERNQNGFEFEQEREGRSPFTNSNFKAGVDYFINDNSTIGVMVNGFYNPGENNDSSRTTIYNNGNFESNLIALSIGEKTNNNINTNINYAFNNKKGTTWNVDLDYGNFYLLNESAQPNSFFNESITEVDSFNQFNTIAERSIDIGTLKIDHERKLKKGKLGAGFKSALVRTDNDFRFLNLNQQTNELEQDDNRTNRFLYDEMITALYSTYQVRIKKWGIEAGLRVENTITNGVSLSAQEVELDSVRRNYTNLFPNLGFTYSPGRVHMYKLSYSRRIDRPRYQNLNPFVYQIDQLSARVGNPFLLPQYSHNVQASYTYKYRYTATLSYSHTTDLFTQLSDTSGERTSIFTTENLESRDVIGINVSAPISPTKWWSVYTNANLNYTRNQGNFNLEGETGKDIDLDAVRFSIFQQQTFNLNGGWSIELSGNYTSPGIWGANYLSQDFWMVNTGVQKRFLDNKAVFKVALSDIFYSGQWGGRQEFGALSSFATGGWQSRELRFNFTYNFGNQKVKKSRRRKTGLEEESKRANGGGGQQGGPGGGR
ncbi:MAG: TonB-dependent receptor [Bacteroidia bacterium]|nr:TonB-dependent receptor [Bacteroidia bacterium]